MKVWPAINASLNALSGILLVIGFTFIKRKNIPAHRRVMISVCVTSLVFLASYLSYHSVVGTTKFMGTGWSRTLYFSILLSHTTLAVVTLPLAVMSVFNGLKMRIPQHRRLVRWTFPIWLYVSVTGVLVYFFLYQWFPSAG